NEIKESGKVLIIFSEQAPNYLDFGLADLISRLSSMPNYKLKKIEDIQLQEFIQTRANKAGMYLSDEVATFIVNRSDRSAQNLNKIVNTLDEQSLAHQRKITIPFVKQILNI
ncbi:MAG: HdaA/DnaA family protein, partial [Kangiellaceae bacterium]